MIRNRFSTDSTAHAATVARSRQDLDLLAKGQRSPVGGLFKRGFDIAFAIVAILSAALLMGLVALCILVVSGRPVLYAHRRVGLHGRHFPCLKFRTMVTGADERLEGLLAADPDARQEFESTRKLKRDPRIMPVVGQFLRQSSLDELPQLFNVLAGDMSIVGPRPVVDDELALYGPIAGKYLANRPGLTGPWQISGRNDISFADRVRIDADYVDNWSFARDLSIILRTAKVVLCKSGAY